MDATILFGPFKMFSSWVDYVSYVKYGRELGVAVTFNDGTTCFYHGSDEQDYHKVTRANSTGKAVHKYLVPLEYTEIDL